MYVIVAVIVLTAVFYVLDLVLRSLKVSKITDKHVFITGCDSGFGRLAAIRFDKLGFHVFAGCLTQDGARSLSQTCSSRVTTVMLDVTSTESIEQAVLVVQQKLPPAAGLWALINNAGITGLFAPSEFCSKQDVQDAINVNLLGVIDVTHHFLPLIRKSEGRIVNTTSSASRTAFLPNPYTVSKFGAMGFSELLRREVCPQGIKVSIVEPGAFRTGMLKVDQKIEHLQQKYDIITPDVQAVYGWTAIIEKIRKTLANVEKGGSPNIDLVVDAYLHAISARFPRTRYVVGTDARMIFIPVSYLPDWISDLIISPVG